MLVGETSPCGDATHGEPELMRTDEDRAAEGGRARYGSDGPGSGSNEPKENERKERDPEWISRQGGDRGRSGSVGEKRDRKVEG